MRGIRWLQAAALCMGMLALSGCGGGGGGDDGETATSTPIPSTAPSSSDSFAATLEQGPVTAQGVDGSPQPVNATVTLSYSGSSGLYLEAETQRDVVLSVEGQVAGNTLSLQITLRGDVGVGEHDTDIVLHACYDEACTQEPAGSPARLPIHYTVQPNLLVQQQVALSRTGSEAAPGVVLPVSIPAAAGAVTMVVDSNTNVGAISAAFDGSAVRIDTQQVPSGTYTAHATLQSTSDPRYARAIDIQYVVAPPAGGEHGLSVDNATNTVNVAQGVRTTQQIQVIRPTWTDAWQAPQVFDDAHLLTLQDAGNGLYNVTIDASAASPGTYTPEIAFSAGPTGGEAVARFQVMVYNAFYVDGNVTHTFNAQSSTADLTWSNNVVTADGVPATWSAVSQSPWLHLAAASGQTGTDALRTTLDPAALTGGDASLVLPVVVSIDRPGITPETIQVSIGNDIPVLKTVSPGALVGTGGRIYVNGRIPAAEMGQAIQGGLLKLSGATLTKAQVISDTRFVGDVSILAIDVTDAQAGQPLQLSIANPIVPSQVQVPVLPIQHRPAAFQALPFGRHQMAQFDAVHQAAYFAGPDTIYRWAYASGAWSLSQTAHVGLSDVASAADGSALYAVDAGHVTQFDADSLALEASGTLHGNPGDQFDAAPASSMHSFLFSADQRALIDFTGSGGSHGVGWYCSSVASAFESALTNAPMACDPSLAGRGTSGGQPVSMVRSATGQVAVGTDAAGNRTIYRAATRSWSQLSTIPAGQTIVAVSEDGTRMVRSDGMLLDGANTQLGNLGSVVPFTHLPAGYALSADGRFGFVYGYQLSGSGASQLATDANVWVVDLRDASSQMSALATLPLPAPVGCGVPLASGESCQHQAAMTVEPGDGGVFVVGPRGIGVVGTPDAVTSSHAPTVRAAASAGRGARPRSQRLPLRGALHPTRQAAP